MASYQYQIEYAKSNRAGCKGCKEKIEKEAIRIGVNQDPDSLGKEIDDKLKHMMLAPKWYHFTCFEKFKGAKWFKENLVAPSQVKGNENLHTQQQEELSQLFELLKSGKRLADCTSDALKSATKNQGILSDAEYEEIEQKKTELQGKTIAQLQAMCAKNLMAKAGTKVDLIEKVSEAMVLGVLPKCPTCDTARVKFNRANGAMTCPGFYDDIMGMFKRCKGPNAEEPIKRIPWEDF